MSTSVKDFLTKVNNILKIERPWFKKLIRTIWILFILFVVGVPLYIYMVWINAFGLFGGLPDMRTVENPENDLSSEVISADGYSLGRYFRYNRSQVTYSQLSPVLVNTLLISEDHRFYQHSGMDLYSFLRVLRGLLTLDAQGGGSTLTQQTAKNFYRTRAKEFQGSLARFSSTAELVISKTKEWIISVELEENLTKEEIIALYLTTVPFNNNAYGIKIAAETYFGKSVEKLNVQEAALLVGMLQGTNRFNPIEFPENDLSKRNDVLRKLYRHKYIKTQEAYDSLCALPLQLNFSVQNHNEGLATYFRSVLQNDLQKWCRENNYDLLESGLKIYVTIDSRMQRMAEEAMTDHMKKLQREFEQAWGAGRNPWVDDSGNEITDFIDQKIKRSRRYKSLVNRYGEGADSVNIVLNKKRRMRVFSWRGERDTLFSTVDSLRYYYRFLHTGLMSMDPSTGAIKAWVGGINHKYFKFDHVHQSKRQPGSTFKPFVYGRAMEDGFSPCMQLDDISQPVDIGGGRKYQAPNANGSYGDGTRYTLRQAMARSLNTITIQLMDKVKPENVADFANRLGIESKLDPVYSLALGTSDVSLDELVGAYSSFVNLGIHAKPYYITRIEDRHGNVLAVFQPHTKQTLNDKTAYTMIHMLRGGVEEEGGSARALSDAVKDNNEVGGKTGTTNNGSDGWFVGITPDLVTGVWVGGEERSIHFPSWGSGAGGKSALPIFDKYMTRVYKHPEVGYKKGFFRTPDQWDGTVLDCPSSENLNE